MKLGVIAILVLLMVSCSTPENETTYSAKKICLLQGADLPIIGFLGESFPISLKSKDCTIVISLKGRSENGTVITISDNPLRSKSFTLHVDRPVYMQENLYGQIIREYQNGVRIALSTDGKYNLTEEKNYLVNCMQDYQCQFSCDDFDGTKAAKCPKGTIPLNRTDLIHKFPEKEQSCCLNYLKEPLAMASKPNVYIDEHLNVFYFGTRYGEDCKIVLIDPSGKKMETEVSKCRAFSRLFKYQIEYNLGNIYGKWSIMAETESGNSTTSFSYENIPVKFSDFDLPYNGTVTVNALGNVYEIVHLDGCGNEVILKINGATETYEVGESYPLGDAELHIKGAQCSNQLKGRIKKAAYPKCPNAFCEIGESKYTCPWDCLDVKYTSKEPGIGSCTRGCYFAEFCLDIKSKIDSNGQLFLCTRSGLEMV